MAKLGWKKEMILSGFRKGYEDGIKRQKKKKEKKEKKENENI